MFELIEICQFMRTRHLNQLLLNLDLMILRLVIKIL